MPEHLKEAIKRTLNNDDFSDVVIVTEDDDGTTHEISASKYVLSARSKVLQSMLHGPFEEGKSNRVSFSKDVISYDTMRSLIHYMYTDEMKVFLDDTTDTNDDGITFADIFSPKRLIKLFNAAHYFQIDELMKDAYSLFKVEYNDDEEFKFDDTIFCTCLVVDTTNISNEYGFTKDDDSPLLEFIQHRLKSFLWNKTNGDFIKPDPKILEENMISPLNIPRIFNRHTISDLCKTSEQKSQWLSFLYDWSKTSPEHKNGALEAIQNIPHHLIDYKLLMTMCDDDKNTLITPEITFNMMRKRIATEDDYDDSTNNKRIKLIDS